MKKEIITQQLLLYKKRVRNFLKKIPLSNRHREWLIDILKNIGVAIISGAILGGVIDRLMWQGILFLLISAFALCYTSYILIKNRKNV